MNRLKVLTGARLCRFVPSGQRTVPWSTQNDEGTWSYYSFNGTSIYSSTSGSVGGAPHNNLGEKTFVSPMAFLNSQYNSDGSKGLIKRDKINGYGYTEGYILPTSPKEDVVIRDNFVKTVNDGYNLISNQCADAVKNALNSVGIDTSVFNYDVSIPLPGKTPHSIPLFSVKIEPYLPSMTFEAIRSNNPYGTYIQYLVNNTFNRLKINELH